eukprot:360428-Chlamydomonas_euryale.AAC.1
MDASMRRQGGNQPIPSLPCANSSPLSATLWLLTAQLGPSLRRQRRLCPAPCPVSCALATLGTKPSGALVGAARWCPVSPLAWGRAFFRRAR